MEGYGEPLGRRDPPLLDKSLDTHTKLWDKYHAALLRIDELEEELRKYKNRTKSILGQGNAKVRRAESEAAHAHQLSAANAKAISFAEKLAQFVPNVEAQPPCQQDPAPSVGQSKRARSPERPRSQGRIRSQARVVRDEDRYVPGEPEDYDRD